MQILLIMLIVVLLAFSVLLLALAKQSPREKQTEDKYHINQILLAIPTATPHQKRDILNICKETGCELKQLPGVYQLVNGEVSLSKMKKVAVEDLLGRDTIKVNMSEIFQYLKGKRILVTGGGGSIGSELCRQIAGHEPELVLQAGTYAKGGEIFVLDMGAPVKIDTLARNLIKLSGYTPDVDIKVTYTGLRPGEKLYEEKLMAEEGMEKTPNDLIHIGKPIEMDVQEFFKQLEVLAAYGYANSEKIRDIVAAIVPTYHSADSDLKLHKKVYEELMSEAAVAAEKN